MRRAGAEFHSVPAIGGGAQSDLLLQTIADVAGFTVTRGGGEATGAALGAALLAAPAELREANRHGAAEQAFKPSPSDALADRLATYRRLTAERLSPRSTPRSSE